jgi:hypothetical protein
MIATTLSAVLIAALSDDALRQRIAQVRAQSQGGGMLPEQYENFYRRVMERAPSRLLVWGLGHDSALTSELNAGGETLFVESSPVWARTIGAAHAHLRWATYEQEELGTSTATWSQFLQQPHGLEVSPGLRNAVEGNGRCWDTILVDAPDGHLGRPSATKRAPGRAVPIYAASLHRARCNTTVFVHDCARTVERQVSRQFLGTPSAVLPASLWRVLRRGGNKLAQTVGGHNAIPKGLCRYGQ